MQTMQPDRSVQEVPSVRVRLDDVRAGTRCQHAIRDSEGRPVVEPGTAITAKMLADLRTRGLRWLFIHPEDAGASEASAPGAASAEGVSCEALGEGPLEKLLRPRSGTPYDAAVQAELERQIESTAAALEELAEKVKADRLDDLGELPHVADRYVHQLVGDIDLVLAVADHILPADDWNRRSIQMALLAMAAAFPLKWNSRAIFEVGLSALLHDIGLYRLPPEHRGCSSPLDDGGWRLYRQHPYHSAVLLESVPRVPPAIVAAVLETHEQADGSGFPRGLRNHQVHPYARLLNVVDAYLTLSSDDLRRPPLAPHDSLVYLLHQGAKGRFDPRSLRALLEALSLFPIGSWVELTDGTILRVHRRRPGDYSTPELAPVEGAEPVGPLAPEHAIRRPVCRPERGEVRLRPHDRHRVLWIGGTE